MAECNMSLTTNSNTDVNSLKSTTILVYVEEALQDVLVVSYTFNSKFFQGILLDSTKRRTPIGVTLPSISNKFSLKVGTDDDLCNAIHQRFTYFQDISMNGGKWNLKKTKNGKIKNTRMNVRLRPRQVLCSKCRSICNENSENVDHSKKASGDQPGSKLAMAVENSRRSLRLSATTIEKSPRPLLYENFKNHQMKTRNSEDTSVMLTPSLVPKLSRLQPNEITSALNGKYSSKLSLLNGGCCLKPVIESPKSESSENKYCIENIEQELAVSLPETGSIPQKSAVDMEEVHPAAADSPEDESKMVLRKKHSVGSMEDLWDESIFEDQMQKTKTTPVLKISFGSEGQGTVLKIPAKVTNNTSESELDDGHIETRSMLRAARKAHKKAKKEAKKRMIAINSPARSPAYENFFCHRSRHKIKRKRKHKYPRAIVDKRDSDTDKSKNEKLSISFKRLGGNAYTATRNESPSSSPSNHSSDEAAPELPDSGLELESIQTDDYSHRMKNGKLIEVGDVVWGKVHGFSWWPGKVLSYKIAVKENQKVYAYVSWFGSSSASVISCDNVCSFLDNYKLRFNKRKKSGQYKEAVKVATVEAKKKRGLQMRSRTSISTSSSTATTAGVTTRSS